MHVLTILQSFLDPVLLLLSDDPFLRAVQAVLLLLGAIDIFFVFFATRDILLRTHSFLYMVVCIFIVAALPLLGFLLYLLIRPARTVQQRETDRFVREMSKVLRKHDSHTGKPEHKQGTAH